MERALSAGSLTLATQDLGEVSVGNRVEKWGPRQSRLEQSPKMTRFHAEEFFLAQTQE